MADVLSQSEIDALLSAISTGEMDANDLLKEEVEKKEHDNSNDSGAFASICNGACKNGHTGTLARRSEEHQLSPAKCIDDPDRNQG